MKPGRCAHDPMAAFTHCPARPPRKAPARSRGAPNLPAGFTGTFTSRYIDTAGLRQHVITGGEGPRLLLVHGWPWTWYAWRLVMPALARDFSIVLRRNRGLDPSGSASLVVAGHAGVAAG